MEQEGHAEQQFAAAATTIQATEEENKATEVNESAGEGSNEDKKGGKQSSDEPKSEVETARPRDACLQQDGGRKVTHPLVNS